MIRVSNLIKCFFDFLRYNSGNKDRKTLILKGEAFMKPYTISPKDREILREVAKKQYALSQEEKHLKRIQEWYAHNKRCLGLYGFSGNSGTFS